jgi:hypothetical protein
VDRGERGDGGLADGDAVAGHDLVDPGEADASQQPSGSLGADDARPARHGSQGPDVEMVEMHVRDEDGVDVLRHPRVRPGAVAAQMSQARAQQRIGQQPRTPELEEHSGVTDPGQALVIARHDGHRSAVAGEAASPPAGEPGSPGSGPCWSHEAPR